ncbi:MarR family transcriptional regulator [Algivirga pacifica]|uniref:HTH-type transcriptional regulator SarZ n=1 Tax=Algivirga pacifica TaxID=1162670 RepID=A0ABP9DBT6_9BACT
MAMEENMEGEACRKSDDLKLENQLCFPFYAVSRLIIKQYQPFLEELDITYPQYLVLMLLWEKDGIPVTYITEKLVLNTNTVTPLLQRLEKKGIIDRVRSKQDERKVEVFLTEKGRSLKQQACKIPAALAQKVQGSAEEIETLRKQLWAMIEVMKQSS